MNYLQGHVQIFDLRAVEGLSNFVRCRFTPEPPSLVSPGTEDHRPLEEALSVVSPGPSPVDMESDDDSDLEDFGMLDEPLVEEEDFVVEDSDEEDEHDAMEAAFRSGGSAVGSEGADRPKRPRLEQPLRSWSFPAAHCLGHLNVRTVKDVQFLGPDQDFVGSGSDDGRLFIWSCPRHLPEEGRPHSNPIVFAGRVDHHVVNCVVSHPRDAVLAVSGIDQTVKILGPAADGCGDSAEAEELEHIVGENERRRSLGHNMAHPSLFAMLRTLRSEPSSPTGHASGGAGHASEEEGEGEDGDAVCPSQ